MKGKVKFFNEGKGFGFIAADDGKEYFVHIGALEPGTSLKEDEQVTFEIEQGDRGPKAANVKKDTGLDVAEEKAPKAATKAAAPKVSKAPKTKKTVNVKKK